MTVFIVSLIAFVFLLVSLIRVIAAAIRQVDIGGVAEAEAVSEGAQLETLQLEAPSEDIELSFGAETKMTESAPLDVGSEDSEVASIDSREAVEGLSLETSPVGETPDSNEQLKQLPNADDSTAGKTFPDQTGALLDSAEAMLELEKALERYVRERASSKRLPTEGQDEPSTEISRGLEEAVNPSPKRDDASKGKVLPEELRNIIDSIMAGDSGSSESPSAARESAAGSGIPERPLEEGGKAPIEDKAAPVSEAPDKPRFDSEGATVSDADLGGSPAMVSSAESEVGPMPAEPATPTERATDESASSPSAKEKKALKAQKEKVLKDLKKITGKRKGLFRF